MAYIVFAWSSSGGIGSRSGSNGASSTSTSAAPAAASTDSSVSTSATTANQPSRSHAQPDQEPRPLPKSVRAPNRRRVFNAAEECRGDQPYRPVRTQAEMDAITYCEGPPLNLKGKLDATTQYLSILYRDEGIGISAGPTGRPYYPKDPSTSAASFKNVMQTSACRRHWPVPMC